jgi:hypothetical protein
LYFSIESIDCVLSRDNVELVRKGGRSITIIKSSNKSLKSVLSKSVFARDFSKIKRVKGFVNWFFKVSLILKENHKVLLKRIKVPGFLRYNSLKINPKYK